jgi:hypothetical protein
LVMESERPQRIPAKAAPVQPILRFTYARLRA